MAAAAFTETVIFKGRKDGRVIHMRLTVSDVAAAYAIAPDGNGFIQLPGDQDYTFSDVIVVTGGTDTTQQQVFCNGLNSGLVIDNKSNLNTANFRQFLTAPVSFKAGSLIRFVQAA
jgi:hypothetical protein